MHVPDGFLDLPTSLATGAVAVAAIGIALRRSRGELDERTVPLAGLVSAFVFAAQMLTFPVGLGTSGHLMGGALAAVLVGPWTGLLCLSVVLLVQALLFADGGLTALGTNITLMGVTAVLVGWLVTRAVLAVLPRRPASVVPAAAVGAFLSVVGAALVFVLLFAVGSVASIPLAPLTVSMLTWHAVIGIGEAVITGLTVSAVLAVRPDLVHAARGRRPPLTVLDAQGVTAGSGADAVGRAAPDGSPGRPDGRRTGSTRRLAVAGGGVVALLAGVGSAFASSSPDGLERVAQDHGFLGTAGEHLVAGSPLADYGAVGGLPVGLAGLLGVAVTVLLGWVTLRVAGRRSGNHVGDTAPDVAHHGQ